MWLFVTPWTIQTILQAEYWREWSFPSGHLPNPGMEPRSPKLQADSLPSDQQSERKWSCSVMSDSVIPWTVACNRLLCPWDFLGKNTRVSYHFLLQGIFPTQGWNPGLPNCTQTLYRLSHQGSPAREVYMGTVYFWNFSKTISKPKWKNNTV